jgi:mannose-6-phosphate isomerase-like protein (cupin superfamily)
MSYTIKNLREVEDKAVGGGFSEAQESRFAGGDLDAQHTGLAYHVVKPGKRQAFAHRHHDAEEINVVISGSGRVKIDDAVLDIGPLDAIRIAPDAARCFEAGPDGLEFVVFGPHHERDGEVVPGAEFWSG